MCFSCRFGVAMSGLTAVFVVEDRMYNDGIPDDYCHKDRYTGEQFVFFCLVCNCDLKSTIPLRSETLR
jgi:hypothetical protein